MADNLPLIPKKDGICAEVRPLLRTVFRELDYLPPLAVEENCNRQPPPEKIKEVVQDPSLPTVTCWTHKYKIQSDQIWSDEGDVKHQHAKRLAREPLPNIYELHAPPQPKKQEPKWKLDRGLLDRVDLMPAIEQNAARDETLWIKNILNVSSGDVTDLKLTGTQISAPETLHISEENTLQTLSVGVNRPVCSPNIPIPIPPKLAPDSIICIPSHLDFVNFVIGYEYTQSIRLINISKIVCRLSVIPPKRHELQVEICGPQGLTVTSGAAGKLKIHFKPVNVLALHDDIPIRVSNGQSFTVHIACYMEPPLLNLTLPNVTASLPMCSSDMLRERSMPFSTLPGGAVVVELGSQLLGDTHQARVLLHCDAEHSSFFVLSEDAWISWTLDCLTIGGSSVVAGPFVLSPAWWVGGGTVNANVWCHGDNVGVHVTPLRIVSSTAVNRQLYLLADVVYFRPDHIVVQAQEKDYDICSEDDPNCEYYVNVGTAFPHRSLTTTIKIFNKSPVIYSYYWASRPWGVCSCWKPDTDSQSSLGGEEEMSSLCLEAKEAKRLFDEDPSIYEEQNKNRRLVQINPRRSQILPHSSCTLELRLPDVGERIGVQRAVLMLILTNIPKDSFPPKYDPAIITTTTIPNTPIPGIKCASLTREVCEVLVGQVEVWWEVVPLRFVLEPVVLPLPYSRRLKSISVQINAWQLQGYQDACVKWVTPERVARPAPLRLSTRHLNTERLTTQRSAVTTFNLPLPVLPNHYPETDVFTLVATDEPWQAQCVVQRWCSSRHPSLRGARTWLGVVPPHAHMHTRFTLTNDTHQPIYYWCEGFRWIGENQPSVACQGEIPCEKCYEMACTCDFLKPTRGALSLDQSVDICYDVFAPSNDGCVVTLVRARRCEADLALLHPAPPTDARASLVAYRVLAPKVVLRLRPCFGNNSECSGGCGLDPGAGDYKSGTAMLRPSAALVLGRHTCYRLRVTNITPLSTTVSFDDPIDRTDLLNVKFIPQSFSLRSYGKKEIRVVLEARRVCERRVFVYRARLQFSLQPVYLLIDTAVSGLQITCQVPIGGGPNTDEFVILRRIQIEKQPEDEHPPRPPPSPRELFDIEDQKREVVQENICKCPFEMLYIQPVKKPMPPWSPEEKDFPRVEFVTSPPPLTPVCSCHPWSRPSMPDAPDSISLQFIQMPLREVWERRVVLHNESALSARWTSHVRRWPRRHAPTLAKDQWAGDVCGPGVVVSCSPRRGLLAAWARQDLLVQVYADCWGFYHDQILIQVENVEPIVLDVWVHAVGEPLHVLVQSCPADLPVLWFSTSDPSRTLLVRNMSREALVVHAYLTHENVRLQDALPLRLYLRLVDLPPRTCACCRDQHLLEETSDAAMEEEEEEMDTDVELYLGPDHGLQSNSYYQASPEELCVQPGRSAQWRVALAAPPYSETAPAAALLLRLQPVVRAGAHWYRDDPAPQVVLLRQAPREPRLKLSCDEIVVSISALSLPPGDFLRVRKHFFVQNVGNDVLHVNMYTSVPWCVVHQCDVACRCASSQQRMALVSLRLPPWSYTDVCVEVCISTLEACPLDAALPNCEFARPSYAPHRRESTPLRIYDDYQVLLTLPLTLDIEYPVIQTEPISFDFGYVTEGDSRKTYITVSHTSRTETLTLETQWIGCNEFEIWPPALEIPPGDSQRLYIQYTAVWRHGLAEGFVHIYMRRSGDDVPHMEHLWSWCHTDVAVHAAPTRDYKCSDHLHDHTDDTHLLPPALRDLRP